MLRTLVNKVKFYVLLAGGTVSADGTSSALNLTDAGSATLLVQTGAMAFSTANKLDLILQESDNGTVFTPAVDVYQAENGTIAKSLDGTEDQNAIHAIYYRGGKKYIHLKMVETGTVSVPLSVIGILGDGRAQPLP